MVGFPLGWIFILSGWRITVLCWISGFFGLIYPFSVFWLHPHTCMTCHLSTKLDVHFVGFTMGDEPLIRCNGTCPWQCHQGRGVLGVAKGMTTWPKGEGVRQQLSSYTGLFWTPPPMAVCPPGWLIKVWGKNRWCVSNWFTSLIHTWVRLSRKLPCEPG